MPTPRCQGIKPVPGTELSCSGTKGPHLGNQGPHLDNQGPFLGNQGQTLETMETKEPLPPPILPSAKIPSGWSL